MAKTTKNTVNKIFKGAILGVACVLSLSAVPFASLKSVASTSAADAAMANTISVANADKTVKKGSAYNIKSATFNKKGSSEVTKIESDENFEGAEGTIKTDISVKYKNSNFQETITDSTAEQKEAGIAGIFIPTMVGAYTITYTVQDGEETFSYDYDVVCEVSEASFEFENNAKEVIPSVYDLSLMGDSPKNITLPQPKVLDGAGEEVKVYNTETKENEDLGFYISAPADKSEYVLISIDDAAGALKQDETTKAYYVDGAYLKEQGARTYSITYAYYQNNQFVTSATKSFDVKSSYYKESSKTDANPGYKLSASFATTRPDKASTGVALALPTVRATTSSESAPASETVNVTYSIKVMRKSASGKYDEDVTASVDTIKNTFTAPKDGDYEFVYTVTDFYGHTVNDTNMTFYIRDVKDDVAPTVTIYDASVEQPQADANGKIEYKSARNSVKNETANRNIVVYAIGVNDNAGREGMTLTRAIRDNGGTTRFTITDYADKNLIFNFGAQTGSSTDPYVQFVEDNFAVKQNIVKAGVSTTDPAAIKEYVSKYFLIVTHNLDKVPGTEETLTGTEAEKKAKLQELGYAYVANTNNYEFSTQTYTVRYSAKDKAGNSVENEYVSMRISVGNTISDTQAPTITFPTSLQNNYLPTDTFKFTRPNVTDNYDDGVELVVAYRYLSSNSNSDKDGALTTDDSTTLTFETNEESAKLVKNNKWFGVEGKHEATGFILPEANSNSEYTVDLNKKPENAAFVEILVYGVDDYGNIGFWSKVISIAQTNDNRAPTLKAVNDSEFENVAQGQKVTLPTLTFSDDLVKYMSYSVNVYHVSEDGKTLKLMPSENGVSDYDDYSELYTLEAGTFTASYAGTYRVVITVKDAGNNTISTFFNVTAGSSSKVEGPVIDNLTTETISLEVDENYALTVPTIKGVESETTGYFGVDETDDGKTATYYNVTSVSSETSYYELTENNFVAHAGGKYEIRYNVFLIEYDKTQTSTVYTKQASNKKTYLMYEKGGTPYYVLVNKKKTVDEDTKEVKYSYELVVKANYNDVTGTTAVTATDLANAGIKLISLQSDTQKFKVSDTKAPVINIDESKYPKTFKTVGESIELQRISATENSQKGINPETSYIEVTTSRASGSSNTDRIYMKDWDAERKTGNITYDNGKLMLKLSENGNYRIVYSVADYSGNVSTKEFSIANGDAEKPEIEVKDGFLNKETFNINDKLVLDREKLGLSDNVTEEAKLKEKMTIKVVNTSTNNELDLAEGTNNTYVLSTAGDYRITISVTDEAGWTTEKTVNITVSATRSDVKNVYKVVGTVLIVLSVVILLGVIGYFIYSKVKLDKELKGANKRKRK